jgi:hypothetical protein
VWLVGGSVPTEGAAAAEGVIGSCEEADESSGASSAGNQGFGVGRKVAMGISVKRGARIVRVGAVKESVGKGADFIHYGVARGGNVDYIGF